MKAVREDLRLAPGSVFLDRYRIEERLGRGGMGEVWAATEIDLDREVAIKLLLRRWAERPEYVRRFEREMRALAKLSHPNIAQLYTAGRAPDGRLYMVMQRVRGITARQALAREPSGRLDMVTAVYYAVQIAEVLLITHQLGIAHRDVKPENVMVASDGHTWLLDFGIAQNVRTGPTPGTAGSKGAGSRLMGTPRYMAPELIDVGKGDHRADFYSLGVTLHELLTGQYPYGEFDDDDVTGLQAAHTRTTPIPLDDVAPDLPEALGAIVRRLLLKNPDYRYASARELLGDLRALVRESVPPDHPVALRLAQDRLDQSRKRAFARREAQRGDRRLPENVVARAVEVPDTGEMAARAPIGVLEPIVASTAAQLDSGAAPRTTESGETRETVELPAGYAAPGLGAPFPVTPPTPPPRPRTPIVTTTIRMPVAARTPPRARRAASFWIGVALGVLATVLIVVTLLAPAPVWQRPPPPASAASAGSDGAAASATQRTAPAPRTGQHVGGPK